MKLRRKFSLADCSQDNFQPPPPMGLNGLGRMGRAFFEHLHDMIVFVDGLTAEATGIKIGMFISGDGCFDAFKYGHQSLVPAHRDEALMPICVSPDPFILRGSSGQASIDEPEFFNQFGIDPCYVAKRQPLQRPNDGIELASFLGGKRLNHESSARYGFDQAVALQTEERFPHRSAADAEFRRQGMLPYRLVCRQSLAHDPVADCIPQLVAQVPSFNCNVHYCIMYTIHILKQAGVERPFCEVAQ